MLANYRPRVTETELPLLVLDEQGSVVSGFASLELSAVIFLREIVYFNCKVNFNDKDMTIVANRIFKDALGLLPVERAELIEKLFQSFDRSASSAVDAVWAEEIESRIDAYESGKIQASSAEDVFARINQR